MFGSLIRRKPARSFEQDDAAFESTTFSLSTAVPRPTERRDEDRVLPTLCIVKVTAKDNEQLVRVRNLSAGGLMAEIGQQVTVGDKVEIEFNSQKIPSTVIWTRDGTAGFKFEDNIDLGELLAGRKPRHGFRPRPPRLEVQCKANLRVGKTYYNCDVHDISLAGSLRPIKGEVRWFADRKAGIVFDKPLKLEELAEWIGKRLELASLKASYKHN
jgi:hypothetical protein